MPYGGPETCSDGPASAAPELRDRSPRRAPRDPRRLPPPSTPPVPGGRCAAACTRLFVGRHHTQRVHVGVEDRLVLLALGDVLLAQPNHGPERLDVVTVGLGLGVDVTDVVGERLLFLFQ